MSWTTEYPTKPGFYWIRNYQRKDSRYQNIRHTTLLVKLFTFVDTMQVWFIEQSDTAIPCADLIVAEWYGPIEPPE
jgi:hypothetical protein